MTYEDFEQIESVYNFTQKMKNQSSTTPQEEKPVSKLNNLPSVNMDDLDLSDEAKMLLME